MNQDWDRRDFRRNMPYLYQITIYGLKEYLADDPDVFDKIELDDQDKMREYDLHYEKLAYKAENLIKRELPNNLRRVNYPIEDVIIVDKFKNSLTLIIAVLFGSYTFIAQYPSFVEGAKMIKGHIKALFGKLRFHSMEDNDIIAEVDYSTELLYPDEYYPALEVLASKEKAIMKIREKLRMYPDDVTSLMKKGILGSLLVWINAIGITLVAFLLKIILGI